jgi:hypothetical protein
VSAYTHFSTTAFSPQTFRPHGIIESKVVGKLFIQEASGPFNKEILLAMDAVHVKARLLLAAGGPWAALFIFKNSALASPEMLSGLRKYLALQVTHKNASIATGLVLPKDVEGASLLTPHYLRAWRDAGIHCEAFEDLDLARAWVTQQLERTLLASPLESQINPGSD